MVLIVRGFLPEPGTVRVDDPTGVRREILDTVNAIRKELALIGASDDPADALDGFTHILGCVDYITNYIRDRRVEMTCRPEVI